MLFAYINLHLSSPLPYVHVQDCYSYIYSQHKTICMEVELSGCSYVCL